MSNQTILERFKNRCPKCNHNEVMQIISEVYCGYCEEKWTSIYDYEEDCELKEGEWVLEDKITALESKLNDIRALYKKAPQSKGIYEEDNSPTPWEGMPTCIGFDYNYDEVSTFLKKLKKILDS